MNRIKLTWCVAMGLGLAACADPLSNVDRLSDVPLAEGSERATVAPGPADAAGAPPVLPGLLAGILESGTAPGDPAAAAAARRAPAAAPEAAPVVAASAPAQGGGFFTGLFGGGSGASATPVSTAAPGATAGFVQIPGAAPLPPGSTVPYGLLATVCGLDASALGQSVASTSGYTVYDTNPRSTAPRTQYITGFGDGCARQFYGSLALFGDIGTHELVRYSSAAGTGYTATDNAYEAIKASYCGASARTPCGARIDALSQRTTFLTIYETFGTGNGWADILLSDGQIVAQDF